jgi:hypothetical protein
MPLLRLGYTRILGALEGLRGLTGLPTREHEATIKTVWAAG